MTMAAPTAAPPKTAADMNVLITKHGEWPYKFELVELGATYIDSRFQRDLKPIKTEFDPRLVGSLAVSHRPRASKTLSVIDGQRRRDRIMRAEGAPTKVCACVFYGLSVEQEAELFSLFQRERKGITPFERFRADLVAKLPSALALQKLVQDEGFEVAQDDGTDMRRLKAIRTLETIYEEDPELLRLTLSLIRRTWDKVPYASREKMLKGVSLFCRSVEDFDEGRFVSKLKDSTPSDLDRRATYLRDSRGLSGNSPKFMLEVITQAYRSNKRAK